MTASAILQIITSMESSRSTKKIARNLLLTLLLGAFLLSTLPVQANDLDQLLSKLIIGTWEEGNVPYGIVTFAADGTYQARMYSTNNKETLLLSLEGTWKIKNSELQSVLTASNSSNAPVGESFADRIEQVNQDKLVLVGGDGQRYSKYRVSTENR